MSCFLTIPAPSQASNIAECRLSESNSDVGFNVYDIFVPQRPALRHVATVPECCDAPVAWTVGGEVIHIHHTLYRLTSGPASVDFGPLRKPRTSLGTGMNLSNLQMNLWSVAAYSTRPN